ncbi:Gustatory receptor 186 [Halyomorpha halys]|nr:Gustatory receptor 186 [Halyomorpha halys]
MVPVTKLKSTAKNRTILQVFQPFFLFFNIIECTSINTHLHFSWYSSAHALLVIISMMVITTYVLLDYDDDSGLEESTGAVKLIDGIKVGCAAGAATICTTINIVKTKAIMNLFAEIEQFSRLFPLRKRPFRWMALRSIALAVLLVSAGVQEIIIEPDTLTALEMTSFVEYYCHLVLLLTEYQFAVFVRVLEGFLMNLIKKLKKEGRKTRLGVRQSVRYELLLKRFCEDLQSTFGLQIVVAVFSSFVVCLISSYFALLYVINWFTGSVDQLPTMTVMYAAWVLFIFLKSHEIISSTHDLRVKAELYAMEVDELILNDTTKYLQSDPILQTYLQGRDEWIMYAGDMLILDFGLITDMAGANTTFLVILLQFGLRPC